ncbi:unnamed protein product [Mytilus coruscus]|uniref:Uncharacterized protein n=1 Tax=Mytilus coruscus TaxID=42192 RepID=A0A6J8BVT5_MYTCO|nr:unnamed protein product [Mytilus coruscus]
MPAPRSYADSLRNFSDRIECSIRGLESLGTSESTFGTILTPIIYNKFPSDVRKNITRDRGNDDWNIESLRVAIKRETKNGSSTKQFAMMNILTDHRTVACNLKTILSLKYLGVTRSEHIMSQPEVVRKYKEKRDTLEDGKYTAKSPWKQDFRPLPFKHGIG